MPATIKDDEKDKQDNAHVHCYCARRVARVGSFRRLDGRGSPLSP
jgi:hypothetical protein